MKIFTFEPELLDATEKHQVYKNPVEYVVEIKLADVVVYTYPVEYIIGFSGWREELVEKAMKHFAKILKSSLGDIDDV